MAEGLEFNEDCNFWCSLIKQITIYGYLEKDVDNYGILKLSQRGLNYIEDPYPITLTKDHDYEQQGARYKGGRR